MAEQSEHPRQVHEPVLVDEVVGWLRPEQGGLFIDCTVGLGGHAAAILAASPNAVVVGLDRDPQALAIAQDRLKPFENRFRAVQANFAAFTEAIGGIDAGSARGVLADLGVSSLQLDEAGRGFSFSSPAKLDMRMDPATGGSAADLVNRLSESELADLIFEYGEERGARKIARAISRERQREPINTTDRLAAIVIHALQVPGRWRIHPATRTFQALRIAVNDELGALNTLIPEAISILDPGGRLAIISYHSLEDRIVKRSFLRESGRCICASGVKPRAIQRQRVGPEAHCEVCGACRRVRILTRKPVRPGSLEINRNPRSRSALLRVCEKL